MQLMFWRWRNLRRVYAALIIIAVVTIAAGWIAQRLRAPDWVWSAIIVMAVATWIVVGALTAMKQWSENRGQGPY